MGPSRTCHRLQGPREAVLKASIAPEGRGEKIGVFHKDYRGVGMEGGWGGHSGPLEGLAEGVQKFQLMTPYGSNPTEYK